MEARVRRKRVVVQGQDTRRKPECPVQSVKRVLGVKDSRCDEAGAVSPAGKWRRGGRRRRVGRRM